MWGMKDYYLGHISDANPLELKKFFVKDPCSKCEVQNLCGGRCLYANITRRWSDAAYSEVCDTVRGLIGAVKGQVSRIKGLITDGKVNESDFEFLKYNGCEIIP
jgi:MoaA/NifB/PqqE/SkfB family radical SAM enzyme